jgi:virulence-associated protein VapD
MKLPTVGVILVAAMATACSSHYSQTDVAKMESDIKAQFEQKGFVVEQVSMIKDSDRHMTGFAKVHKPGVLLSKLEVTKNCTAAMDADSGKSIWECK